VGLSRVNSGLDAPEEARQALARARELAPAASPREQRRIELRGKQLEAMDALGDGARHAAYKKALDEALAADIGDVELWLLRGNAEEPTAAGRGQRGSSSSSALYLEALRRSPDNAAAHHYLIHSYETIGQIDDALVHGEAYARLAPSIPHAHHMWGHDLRRVGRVDDAIAAFRRTDELERAYYAAEGIDRSLDWHRVHNLDLLAGAYQHKGQLRLAEATLREALAQKPVAEYVEYSHRGWPMFLLSRGRNEEALDAARELSRGKWAPGRLMGHVLAGQALLGLGRTAEARAELVAARAELETLPVLMSGLTVLRGAVAPYVEMLDGELKLRTGEAAAGREQLRGVERALRAVPGPDAWIQALFRLEYLGRLAREVGDWELAELTARQMLEHDAAYGGSHLALALVAEHRGDAAAAARGKAEAARLWRDADPELAELRVVRAAR
jgi:tetratricopeptide (TPR) repeat protein